MLLGDQVEAVTRGLISEELGLFFFKDVGEKWKGFKQELKSNLDFMWITLLVLHRWETLG